MLQSLTASTLLLATTLGLAPALGDAAIERDIVLLIDRSAGAHDEAVEGLLAPGLAEFLQNLPADTRVGAFTFAAETHSVAPLGPSSPKARKRIESLIAEPPAEGRASNGAIAMERAIYELKHKGRHTAAKAIVVLGNGVIDTGDPAHDAELSDWMRGDLIAEAVDARLRMFWVVPTQTADFPLIQSLTHKSGGAYFRAATPEDFRAALASLRGSLAVSSDGSAAGGGQRSRPGWPDLHWLGQTPATYVVWGGVMAIGSLGALFILWRVRRGAGERRKQAAASRAGADHPVAHALLRDPSGFTGTQAHELTDRSTRISRRPEPDGAAGRTIVISDTAISRRHALIEHRDHGYWVTDLGSVNGTYINDQRIFGEHPLHDGDILRFARYAFEFVLTEPKPLGKTIFAKSRFLKAGQRPARSAGARHADPAQPPAAAADSGDEVTLLRPKK